MAAADGRHVLDRWLTADHDWKPSTWVSTRPTVKALRADPLADCRVVTLHPSHVREAMGRWKSGGATVSMISGRFRILRASISWACQESILERNPLEGMRGPPRPGTRTDVPSVRSKSSLRPLNFSVRRPPLRWMRSREKDGLHKSEQLWLLARLAADSGARRGELAALRFDDLDGRVLTIERAVSAGVLGPTKSRQMRLLTLGDRTVEISRTFEATWRGRAAVEAIGFGPWLFARDLSHRDRLTADCLSHWFAQLCAQAQLSAVSLHRLRHTVATFLVSRGDLLIAQQRLGHRDPSTTLRNYAHAIPLTDGAASDVLDEALGASLGTPRGAYPASVSMQ